MVKYLNKALRDDMPLVHHHELEQDDERVDDVVEIIGAIVVVDKLRVLRYLKSL